MSMNLLHTPGNDGRLRRTVVQLLQASFRDAEPVSAFLDNDIETKRAGRAILVVKGVDVVSYVTYKLLNGSNPKMMDGAEYDTIERLLERADSKNDAICAFSAHVAGHVMDRVLLVVKGEQLVSDVLGMLARQVLLSTAAVTDLALEHQAFWDMETRLGQGIVFTMAECESMLNIVKLAAQMCAGHGRSDEATEALQRLSGASAASKAAAHALGHDVEDADELYNRSKADLFNAMRALMGRKRSTKKAGWEEDVEIRRRLLVQYDAESLSELALMQHVEITRLRQALAQQGADLGAGMPARSA